MARYAPIKAAEEIYSLNWYTLRRWIREGKITGYRIGDRVIRVDLDEIDALMKPLPVTSGGDHDDTTDEDQRRPGRGGADKIDPGARSTLGADPTAARTVRVLRECGYPGWVIEGVLRLNRMREAGVKWEIRPIVYPKRDESEAA